MPYNNNITNEESDTSNTEDNAPVGGEETTNQIPEDLSAKATGGNVPNKGMTPTEIAKMKHYEKEAQKNEKISKFYDRLITIVTGLGMVLGAAIAILAVYWGYKISSIAEPIGALKEKVSTYEANNQKLEDRIKNLEDKITETREEFLRNSIIE